MKTDNYFNVILGVALGSVLISVLTVLFSYRVYTASQKTNAAHQQSLQTMQATIDQLENRLAELNIQKPDDSIARTAPENRPIIVHTSRGPDEKQQAALKRLEQIVDSTGLNKLADSENMDPERLQKMVDEYAYREQVIAHRQRLLDVNQQLHRSDESSFDPELDSLYQLARQRGRGEASAAERDNAFNEMLEKYPDAYATGMVIAERALVAAFRQNTNDLENYYNQLSANENFSGIVTDRGLEAMPNIQYNLARQYIKEGRIEEAGLLIENLEKNYTGSFLAVRSRGRRPNLVPAGQVVERLRRQIE